MPFENPTGLFPGQVAPASMNSVEFWRKVILSFNSLIQMRQYIHVIDGARGASMIQAIEHQLEMRGGFPVYLLQDFEEFLLRSADANPILFMDRTLYEKL